MEDVNARLDLDTLVVLPVPMKPVGARGEEPFRNQRSDPVAARVQDFHIRLLATQNLEIATDRRRERRRDRGHEQDGSVSLIQKRTIDSVALDTLDSHG